jgi:hypothetical protein
MTNLESENLIMSAEVFDFDYEYSDDRTPEECMEDLLKCVKPEHKDMVKSEMEKLGNEFARLTPEQREEIYNTDGVIGWVWDYDRLKFDVEEVFDGSDKWFRAIDRDRPEYNLEEAILDYLLSLVRSVDAAYEESRNAAEEDDYYIEDDRFLIEYNIGGIYVVTDKKSGEEFIMDNVDADTSLKDLLYMVHEFYGDEE